jgi:glucuronoarabinoxylan endo-1,4-beta-xylanase
MSSRKLCKSLFIVFFVLSSLALSDSNLLQNPGFEDGTVGWAERSCRIAAVSSPVHSGSGSAKVSGRREAWQGIRQTLLVKMVEGETYQITGWVRLDNAASGTIMASFEQRDEGGTKYPNAGSITATNSEWSKISGTFTLEVEGTLTGLDFYFEGPPAGVNFYVDDVNVYGPAGEPVEEEPVKPAEPEATGVIDVNTRHQKIEGFGASGAYYTMEFTEHQKKDELYNCLFRELGLDIFRIRNNFGMEPNSFRETVEIVKGAQAAADGKLKIMMTSWSPPASMKSNNNTIGGTLKKVDGKYIYDDFAQWWYDSLVSYTLAGVDVNYINIQNEPDYTARWDSCRFAYTETLEMAGYATAFETVQQKLRKEMGPPMPKMLAAEAFGIMSSANYIKNLKDLSVVYGYSHHLYDCSGSTSGCGSEPDLYLQEMKIFREKYPDKPVFQTEYQHREEDAWKQAIDTAILMHNSLAVEEVAGYLYWDLFWGFGNISLVRLDNPSTYTINPPYYTFKQYSAFISSGWQRVDAVTENTGLRMSAYISPDNKKVTVVIINVTPDVDISLDLVLKGMEIGEGEIYRSSREEKSVSSGSYKAGGQLKLPASSVTTVVLRSASTASPGDTNLTSNVESSSGNTNILGNADCEDGTAVWGGRSCEIVAVGSPVHSGSGSIKVTGRDSNWQGIRQSIYGKVVEGVPYQVSGWVRLDNAASDNVAISVEQQDDGGTRYIGVASGTATNGEWVKLSGEFTLDVNGALSVLDVYFEGPAPGVSFYIDDANMYGPEVVTEKREKAKPQGEAIVDASTRHQKIEGIGASGAFRTQEFLGSKDKAKLYELLFKDLRLDIFRIRNTYDISETDFNESVEIVKGAKAVVGQDMKIMISPWTPPASLKSNGSLIGGTLKKTDGSFAYAEYAQWWYDSLAAYANAGVKADYITMQNEPDFEAQYDSCIFAPTESNEVAGYNTACEALWQKLSAEMGADMPKMLDPETMGFTNIESYIKQFDNLSHTYGYAHHLYGCTGCAEEPDRYIPKMVRFKEFNSQYGNKPIFQTEFEDKPDTWTGAMNTAILMHNSLVVEGVAGYLYWDLFWGEGSGLLSITDPHRYVIMPVYYAFKHYSAFIDSDWQRVEASTDNKGVRISAYISPDNKKLNIILINTEQSTDISLDLSLKGIEISGGEVFRSSKNESCISVGSYKKGEPLKLPAYSITTVSLVAGPSSSR